MREKKSLIMHEKHRNDCPMSTKCLDNVYPTCLSAQFLPNVVRGQISDFFRYVSSINWYFWYFMIFVIRYFCLNNVCIFSLFDFLGSFIPFLFKKSKDWISVNPIGKSPFYLSQKSFFCFFGETLMSCSSHIFVFSFLVFWPL